MPRGIKYLLITLILILASCNSPQPVPKQLPTDTNTPPLITDTVAALPQPTNTSLPEITEPEPTSQPLQPTQNSSPVLLGDVIPLLQAGTEVTILEIHMVDELHGWSVTSIEPGIDHILKTSDGGYTWQDVSPPQPLGDPGSRLRVSTAFEDKNTAWAAYRNSDLVWATQDGGVTWQAVQLEFDTRLGSLLTSLDKDHAWMFQFLDAGMHKLYSALYRTQGSGLSWIKLLDPYTDSSIQSFDKTGVQFINSQYGWFTEDSGGVAMYVDLNITQDGGQTWEILRMPAPSSKPEIFSNCYCAMFNPFLTSPQQGAAQLTCRCSEDSQEVIYSYLYKTSNGGGSWEILEAPTGDLYFINEQVVYSLHRDYSPNREIYRSEDGGANWVEVKTVFWKGQFSFINRDTAWVVAYDWEDDEYALVKTSNGCNSFVEIKPEIISSPATR